MKVSYNWLKAYLDFPYTAQELDAVLTETGLEVEGIETYEEIKGGLQGVVIGEVLSCEKHPDADKLKVTKVNVGLEEPLQIVCGAPNVATGQKVLVATVGCTLYPQPDQAFEIKKAKIRGVASEGMLCAEDELGLGSSHDGILVLDPNSTVGMPAAQLFELTTDQQLEIGLTPNRADAMGHIGVARDIKAYQHLHRQINNELKWPAHTTLANNLSPLIVKISNQDACKAYYAVKLDQIKVGPSPAWLQQKLKAVGLKPINNIVDCSNFVMRELGTPLHIFDANQIKGQMEVRSAQAKERFTALDGQTYEFKGTELLIADQEGPLCLAGIMGGKNSGVSENTTEIVIESAVFDAVSIRKAARAHGFNTDASFRFERGVDPDLTIYALERCVYLIQQCIEAKQSSNVFAFEGNLNAPIRLELSLTKTEQLIGCQIEAAVMKQILIDLDFKILSENGDLLQLEVPRYRIDVTRPIDVIEEIIRIYGLNQIPLPEKWNFSLPVRPRFYPEKIKESISEFLVGKGFNEILNNSLTKKSYAEKFGVEGQNAIEILNPLSQDLGILRQSLIFGLLECFEYNQNRQQSRLKIFEFGQQYNLIEEDRQEKMQLAIGIMDAQNANFFDLKAAVYSLLERLGLAQQIEEKPLADPHFEDGLSLDINGTCLAKIGWASKSLQTNFDLKQVPYIALVQWSELLHKAKKQKITFQELPKSFAAKRDLSLLIDKKVQYQDLKNAAFKAEKRLLQNVHLFDVYEGKNLDADKKSYALSFYLQDKNQTLTDKQIEKSMQQILQALEKECGAKLRL